MNDFDKLKLKKFNIKSILPDATVLCLGRRRSGKCLEKGTKVLMYNGSIKVVEDIILGDLLMGDDSTPRTVLGLNNGIDILYKITDNENNIFCVNSNHILSLRDIGKLSIYKHNSKKIFIINWIDKDTFKIKYKTFSYKDKNEEIIKKEAIKFLNEKNGDNFLNIPINKFLELPKKYQNRYACYRLPINPINPVELTKNPYEIGYEFAKDTLLEIPLEYKFNTIDNRKQLLTGFINYYTKNIKTLFILPKMNIKKQEEILYIIKSLGLYMKNGILYLDYSKNIVTNKFKIEQCNIGEYYGFELDKNHKFVLGNFLITHNSFLVRDIFYNHKYIPSGVVFSGTEEASPFFSDFIPECFIHANYDPSLVDSILHKQKRSIREAKKNKLSEDGKTVANNKFMVLDDMLHDAVSWRKDTTIKNIFFNGRHFNILFILTMQYAQSIPPDLRGNVDYVFIFNESSITTRKKIYEAYGGMIKTFDHFCNILDECTKDYECLVIKTSGQGINDQVFWYKAKPHKNFKVGHPDFWKYHYSKFNENYAEEADNDAEEENKIKRKFGKTKKLKVIVSRSGKIVDCEEN